jgi:hypothetical protein
VNLIFLTAAGRSVDWGASLLQFTLPALLLNTLGMLPLYNLLRGLQTALYPPVITS